MDFSFERLYGFAPSRGRRLRRLVAQSARTVALPVHLSDSDGDTVLELARSGVCLTGSIGLRSSRAGRVADVIDVARGSSVADEVERGRRAVAVRRAASVGGECPRISVLLASKRPHCIVEAARLVAAQTNVEVELIAGLHGSVWDGWAEDELLGLGLPRVVVVKVRDEISLGGVLNAVAAKATLPIVSKWDDDDWYGSRHLEDLAAALEYSGATMVGKAAEFVYLTRSDVTIRRDSTGAERFSDRLAGGTLLLRRSDLMAVGGWPDVRRHVDLGLIRTVRSGGGRTYRVHGFDYMLQRRSGEAADHTWSAEDEYFVASADRVWSGRRIDRATS